MSKCINFPKRYNLYVNKELVDLARSVYNNVICANNIYPKNSFDAYKRRNYLISAKGNLKCLIGQLELAASIMKIPENSFIHWMELIDKELKLIEGTIASDDKRFDFEPLSEEMLKTMPF